MSDNTVKTNTTEPSAEDVLKNAIRIVREAGFIVTTPALSGSVSPTRVGSTEWVSHSEVRSFFSTLKIGDRVLQKSEIARILNKSVSLISTVTADSEDGLNRHWSRQTFEAHKTVLLNAVAEANKLNDLLNA